MGIASTKQALMSKPRLTLNKSARKSARKHRDVFSVLASRTWTFLSVHVGRAVALLGLLFYPALHPMRVTRVRQIDLLRTRLFHGAIAKGAQAVVDGKLDYKQASILGYYLQLALSNAGRVDFKEEPETVGV